MSSVALQTDLEGLKLFKQGKVRDVYEYQDYYLIVATDRISAFDCVLPNGIPGKGAVLTQLSKFWFDLTADITENHLISTNVDDFPEELHKYRDVLADRTMLVKKAELIDFERVVRGYIIGSGWKDYQKTGAICGIDLPAGLQKAEQLPEVIFTPASKAQTGHDENVSEEVMANAIGTELTEYLKQKSIEIYTRGREHAATKGIILADTKFEFGKIGDDVIMIDEILTPDSSRFWPADEYGIGQEPKSFDKQFVRNYLESLDWDKTPPAPELPDDIVENQE